MKTSALSLEPFAPDHPILLTPCIWHPDNLDTREDYSVVLFRKTFSLPSPLQRGALWVSASQRFILYLDGRLIARGPSRAAPLRWRASRVELPALAAGPHTLAVCVAHFGDFAGMAQMGPPAFLLVQGDHPRLKDLIDTGKDWKCRAETARRPVATHAWGGKSRYFVVGAGEEIHAEALFPGWELPGYDDADWPHAHILPKENPNHWGNLHMDMLLHPDTLPPMEESPVTWARLAEARLESPAQANADARENASRKARAPGRANPSPLFPLRIPSQSRARYVLDRGAITNAYLAMHTVGGKGAIIRLILAEAPYDADGSGKTDRDVTEGRQLLGHLDIFHPSGGTDAFAPLWFRSFRFAEIEVTTGSDPLSISAFDLNATGYPLAQRARFVVGPAPSASPSRFYRPMWDVSWNTIRLCAHELFFDCPHFEQCQFEGDTRVQAVYHYLVAGDDRLARKAIDDFHSSRLPSGLTQCRYPSRKLQILPTFSLFYIGILYDFLLYRGDGPFLNPYLPGARELLEWFLRHVRPDGLLGRIPFAPFVDWAGFPFGNAPQDDDGGSSILTLQLALACRWMAALEKSCGYSEMAPVWLKKAHGLEKVVLKLCYVPKRGLLSDTPAKPKAASQTFSVHAQVFGVLCGLWPSAKAKAVLERSLDTTEVMQPGSFYFRYYVVQALTACGWRERVFQEFRRWERPLAVPGLETWPETDSDNPRSDCHAWSVTPAIGFLQIILGIAPDPELPGMRRVRFDPFLGPLNQASGRVPTEEGYINVKLKRHGKRLEVSLESPVPIRISATGKLLKPGKHKLVLPAK